MIVKMKDGATLCVIIWMKQNVKTVSKNECETKDNKTL